MALHNYHLGPLVEFDVKLEDSKLQLHVRSSPVPPQSIQVTKEKWPV